MRLEARDQELLIIVEEQTRLRRVAELVARGAALDDVFGAAANEASLLVGEQVTLTRFEDEGVYSVVAVAEGAPVPLGTRVTYDPGCIADIVQRTGGPARIDDYGQVPSALLAHQLELCGAVGNAVLVDGQLWGVILAMSTDSPLPPATEHHLSQFAELIGAAITNASARTELRQLAEEQSSLRRVAELVARGAAPDEIFAAVASETSALMDADVSLTRYEADGSYRVIAGAGVSPPIGTCVTFEPGDVADQVRRTSEPARIDEQVEFPDALIAHRLQLRGAAGAPITVDGRAWGALLATSSPDVSLPAGSERRLAQFADLVGAAVANAESRGQLTASRARVVAAADESRRRLQRDVHDGAQQLLVQAQLTLKLAVAAMPEEGGPPAELVRESLQDVERATAELRDLVHGILPHALVQGGLDAGVESLATKCPLPVDTHISIPRLGPELETTAYFIIAEALTNAVKHADATRAWVRAELDADALRLEISDDGKGGADERLGSGLTGLRDRTEAARGTLAVTSPAGEGTTIRAALPMTLAAAA
jgi:signal transduction histidine kinase